jgi:hypothetical protein
MLPYGAIKDDYNKPGNTDRNPFFGKWRPLAACPDDLTLIIKIVDTTQKVCYTHPYITERHVTQLGRYYLCDGVQLSFGDVRSRIRREGVVYLQTDTMEGQYIVIADPEVAADTVRLAAIAYQTLAARDAPAIRPVEASDRQVHWVWFRRDPSYRLTEEIVLRAASWIELNPGYTFHLWTGLQDTEELADFIATLPDALKERYFHSGSIRVHYEQEFREMLYGWFEQHMPDLLALFKSVWTSPERQDIVMKTDYARNIILAIHGGIYADFNDLVCLAPIEPVLEAHAGNFIGVTDNTSVENASNYFMYAAVGHPTWLEIVKRCTATLPDVRRVIHDPHTLSVARKSLEQMIRGTLPDIVAMQNAIDRGFVIDRINTNNFMHAILLLCDQMMGPTQTANDLRRVSARSSHNRYKPNFFAEVTSLIRSKPEEFQALLDHPDFDKTWRYAYTDMNLRPIMYRTNLPIFCRQQKIPIYLMPFSYLLRYACLFSFVGHLGDGTSYGKISTNRVTMRWLLGCQT